MPEFSSQGLNLFYEDFPAEGAERGPPVLLVHGFASTYRINWVHTRWVETLTRSGRRVIAFDNRGHGRSAKVYEPEAYDTAVLAQDARNLIDHLGVGVVDLMGYSMGARISAYLTRDTPERVRRLVLGGLGDHLVEGVGLPLGIAEAMEARSLDDLTDPMQRLFRRFAESSGGDLRALAACIQGTRKSMTRETVGEINRPTLVAVGDRDAIAGDPLRLAAMLPLGRALIIPGRDHNLAVGDKVYKAGVLDFFDEAA